MKVKIIRAFMAVYLVLSMAYGGIRAAYLTVKAAMTPPESTLEQVELAAVPSFGAESIPYAPEEMSAVLPSPSIQAEDDPEKTEVPAEIAPAEAATAPQEASAAEAEPVVLLLGQAFLRRFNAQRVNPGGIALDIGHLREIFKSVFFIQALFAAHDIYGRITDFLRITERSPDHLSGEPVSAVSLIDKHKPDERRKRGIVR